MNASFDDETSDGNAGPEAAASRGPWVAHTWRMVLGGLVLLGALIFTQTYPQSRWEQVTGPERGILWESLVATPSGFAVASMPRPGGGIIWSSADGREWSESQSSIAPSRLTPFRGGIMAWTQSEGRWLEPIFSDWREVRHVVFPELLRIGSRPGAVGLLGGSEGLLGETVYGDVLWSPDAISFRPVLRSPTDHDGETLVPTPCESGDQSSPEVAPTAATPDGFLVLIGSHTHRRTSIWPVCEPDVWISDTGATWTLGNDDLPFGAGAYVYDIAWRDGVFVAVGGLGLDDPAAWTSLDGLTWRRFSPATMVEPYVITDVEAGPFGWLLLGELTERPELVGWVSIDAECWQSLPPEVQGRAGAVGGDRILVANPTNGSLWIGRPAPSCQ